MIANAMFFRSSSEEVNPNEVQIGILRFSMSILFISIIGILITTPPILIVTIIFKKCKPKPVTNRHKEIKDKMKQQVLNSMTKETQQMLRSEELFSSDHLPLPYWTVYIAWVIVAIAVATSAFFLLLYSMQWGKSKSEEWLSSFVFSFFESLLLVDPFKVVLIALIFAILFRRPVDGSSPKVNMERLRDASMTFRAGSTRTYLALWNDVIMKNKKTSEEELKKVRKRREQELRAMDALMNLIMYGVFVFILYSISYVNRDQRSFFLKNNVDNYLHAHGFGQVGFSSVNGREQWKEWMDKTLIPTCYPKEEYNGSPLSTTDTQFFGDLTNVRVGPARLRQVRMATDGCVYKKLTWPYPCVNPYNQYNEDESDYWLEWKPYNATLYNTPAYTNIHLTADAWKYTKSKDIWGIPITGQYATYGGGGYLLKFPKDRTLSERMLNELMEFNWIDRGTRAVFMEFTLYNANTNLFLYAQFLAEFSELGGAFNWIESQAFRPVTTVSGVGAFSLLCYILFCFHLIITTVKTVLRMKKLGCKSFLFDPWNVVDSFCVFLSYALIFMFGFRLSYANQAMQKYYDDLGTGARDFINFQHIVVWDNSFNVVLATLVFIATIRILRILGYNKRFSEVASVISHAAGELMGFSVVFGIIYFAYISLGYLLFGVSLKEYRSPFATWGSLTNALIGKNSLDKMLAVAPQMAQFYYFTYVFCVLMTLATMFAAILNKSISEVRAESSKEPETFGITNLLTKSIQDVFGFASKSKNKNIQRKSKSYAQPHTGNFFYITYFSYRKRYRMGSCLSNVNLDFCLNF
ncbi:hypothetical protein FSP39_010980 [Pinctada imbricata]|uniref:Uncharacterized protein n=1 Tax=Pinctada imbricata TaxID=66713 RepID=A0AA88XXN2_PINIB|nr:hypothetical protein FSP39_010980 [Pinctada imbricata]